MINNEEENPAFIGNIPVIQFNEYSKLHIDYPVYTGTRGIYHGKLIVELKKYGFTDIFPVTVEMDLKLCNDYLGEYFASIDSEFKKY